MPNESGNLGAALEDLDDIRVVGSVAFLVGSGDGVSDFLVSCVVVCVLVEGSAIVWPPRPRIHHAPSPAVATRMATSATIRGVLLFLGGCGGMP